ncbi:type II toxin-antitoxin system VapC family toxin [Candidatus Poribacteria bacterium]|nr:type II toxin-antitoxin system VapC family toxin [Candidatus Poribacteria bacterium]
MKLVFLDTSGLVGLVNAHDRLHQKATQVYQGLRVKQITTDAVLVEAGNLLRYLGTRHLAGRLKDRVEAAKQLGMIEVVHVDEALMERAWQLYRNRPDKEWSMTDCISFIVMQDRGVVQAFTDDHHFEQAGFVKLL